ncbi:hypothetical protein B0T10DRAFT_565174 [Thelonectria olida]|uniref:Gag protein n=1 Tax=Thelonectria olida TaxID=1576542 RepID=A0A9P9ALS3_9HYPO|nr:hypothetical protein B0T10DRAFT_565174 [Thelonectria olida]
MTTNSTTRLVTGQDWITWFKTLKTKAKREDLWDFLDPTKTNKPELTPTAPTPPDITKFRKKHASSSRGTLTNTPSTSTQSTDTIIAQTDNDDPTFQEGDDIAIQAQDVNELTEKGLRTYNALWTNYEHRNKLYLQTVKKIKTIEDWVMDTIDETHSRHHCSDEKSLAEWIQSLYDEFSLAEDERKQKARRVYREILAEPSLKKIATYQATSEWLTRWRNAINEAQDVKLQEATEPDQWLNDLTGALRSTPMESWINAYSVTQTLQVRGAIGNQPEPLRKARVAHGAFHGGGSQGEGEDDYSQDARRRGGKKRQRESMGGDRDNKCPACYLFHPLAKCYYAFPEKRPEGFKLASWLKRKVEKRIEENEDNLADRIRKIKLEGST